MSAPGPKGAQVASAKRGRGGEPTQPSQGFWLALVGFLIIVAAVPAGVAVTVVASFAREGGEITAAATAAVMDISRSMEPMLGVYMWMVGIASTLAIAIGALTMWASGRRSFRRCCWLASMY